VAYWIIKCYRSERGRELFYEAYLAQSFDARAELRAVINGLKDQPEITGWARENGFDLLSGKKYRSYRGLAKLRFKADGVQHRPLGFFGPGIREFTLLIWATERGGAFHPRNVLDTALTRMNEIKGNRDQAYEYHF